jgi:hypothetical protein
VWSTSLRDVLNQPLPVNSIVNDKVLGEFGGHLIDLGIIHVFEFRASLFRLDIQRVAGFEVELDSFSITELLNTTGTPGCQIERDLYFQPVALRTLQEQIRRERRR